MSILSLEFIRVLIGISPTTSTLPDVWMLCYSQVTVHCCRSLWLLCRPFCLQRQFTTVLIVAMYIPLRSLVSRCCVLPRYNVHASIWFKENVSHQTISGCSIAPWSSFNAHKPFGITADRLAFSPHMHLWALDTKFTRCPFHYWWLLTTTRNTPQDLVFWSYSVLAI